MVETISKISSKHKNEEKAENNFLNYVFKNSKLKIESTLTNQKIVKRSLLNIED